MVMGEYRINLRMMCPKERSVNHFKFTQNAISQNENSRLIACVLSDVFEPKAGPLIKQSVGQNKQR